MKIATIKELAEKYSEEELRLAEEAILNEQPPTIEVEGADEAEQLTHILAAMAVKEDMRKNGSEINVAVRNYSQRVRKSIS